MVDRQALGEAMDALLEPGRFRDYCPNGLQVEGKSRITRLASGVTASLALIERAIDEGADAIIVHHGLFWRGDDMRIVATRRARLARLLSADVNLFAYHLPLDAHPSLGNNAQLGMRLGLVAGESFGEQELGRVATIDEPLSAAAFTARVALALGREPLLLGDATRQVRRIAWCTGGAQGYFEAAIAAGADLYLSGEASEQTTHLARESGVPFVAAGHHATERYGACALAEHFAQRFGLAHAFHDIDNPV
ncbi:MAG: Nif3-like dinuclear metal center hexameric protein [Burkholderiales bacterium]|nr:Nif3-like dinuclear metal center hexameric protein [Burkholderiales bacterium]